MPNVNPIDQQLFSGKYVIQQELGRGGMGVIYLAIDARLDRKVAIKVLHPQYSSDQAFRERFLREARAMARLDHDNIIRIHAVEEQQNSLYIVMEYFAGRDLKQQIRERGRLSLEQTLSASVQLASALAYAHHQGIIHRDIKPANIMIDQSGKVKIADFGIAAALNEISITLPGQIIGTPQYMSPEQANGGRLDGRSDLYSLGIVMYEVLVGQTPYHDISQTAILGQLMHEQRDVALQFPNDIPATVQDLIRQLVKRHPQERLQDAETLLHQLRDASHAQQPERDIDATQIVAPMQQVRQDSQSAPHAAGPDASRTDVGTAATDILPGGLGLPPSVTLPRRRAFSWTSNLIPVLAGSLAALALIAGILYSVLQNGTIPPPPPPPADRRQLEEFIQKFKTAYENKDLKTLTELSELSEDRSRLLKLMFRNYSTITVDVKIATVTDQDALGSVVITKLIDLKGNPVPVTHILANTEIRVRRDGNQWGKVVW